MNKAIWVMSLLALMCRSAIAEAPPPPVLNTVTRGEDLLVQVFVSKETKFGMPVTAEIEIENLGEFPVRIIHAGAPQIRARLTNAASGAPCPETVPGKNWFGGQNQSGSLGMRILKTGEKTSYSFDFDHYYRLSPATFKWSAELTYGVVRYGMEESRVIKLKDATFSVVE